MAAILMLLASHGLSLRPIVLIPGLYGSDLYASYKDFDTHWYCQKKMENEQFWVNLKYVGPTVNCLFELMRANYNYTDDTIGMRPNVDVDVTDFGGEGGVSYVDGGIFGHHFIQSLHPMIKYFKSQGYTIKKDLFGCPYDWRLAMAGLTDFFPKLKSLIESAYEMNNGQKITLLGYSCGGFCVQHFLSHLVSAEWKVKYIAKVIFLAPAFAGASDTLDVAWNRYFPFLPFLKTSTISDTIERVPAIHALFPNHVVYDGIPLIYGPNGEKYYAKDIPDFLVDNGKFHDDSEKMMRKNVEFGKNAPSDIGVPIYMIYNSGIKTLLALNFKDGYKNDPSKVMTEGDGTVPKIGPEWACNNWAEDKAIVCHDVKNSDQDFSHMGMSTNSYVLELIYKAVASDDWVNQGKSYFEVSPYVKVHHSIKDDILSPVVGHTIQEEIRGFMKWRAHIGK